MTEQEIKEIAFDLIVEAKEDWFSDDSYSVGWFTGVVKTVEEIVKKSQDV